MFRRFHPPEVPLNADPLDQEFGGHAALRIRIYVGERDNGGAPH